MAGDFAQDVEGDSGVGKSGEPGVPEVVAAQVLVAEMRDHLVAVVASSATKWAGVVCFSWRRRPLTGVRMGDVGARQGRTWRGAGDHRRDPRPQRGPRPSVAVDRVVRHGRVPADQHGPC